MVSRFAAIGLTAVIALSPLAALAETDQLAQAAPADGAAPAPVPTGSYKSQMRHRSNMSKERARAGAHHMHKMRTTPAGTAPKT